ncbi:hypothetical protein ACU8KH_03071 [Lachancea thermotolerans]
MSKGDVSPKTGTPLSHHSQELPHPIDASKITLYKSTPTRRVNDEKNSIGGPTLSPSASAGAYYGSNRLLSLLRTKNERTEGSAHSSDAAANEYPSTSAASSLTKIIVEPTPGSKDDNAQSEGQLSNGFEKRSFHSQVSNWISNEDAKLDIYPKRASQKIDIPLLSCNFSRTTPSTPSEKAKSGLNLLSTPLSGRTSAPKHAPSADPVPHSGQSSEPASNVVLIPLQKSSSQTSVVQKPSSAPTTPAAEQSLIKAKTTTSAQTEPNQSHPERLLPSSALHKECSSRLTGPHSLIPGTVVVAAPNEGNSVSSNRASNAPSHNAILNFGELPEDAVRAAAMATPVKEGSNHDTQGVISAPSDAPLVLERQNTVSKSDRNLRPTTLNPPPRASSRQTGRASESVSPNPRRRGKSFSAPKVPVIVQPISSSLTKAHLNGSIFTNGDKGAVLTHSPSQTKGPASHDAVEQNNMKVVLPVSREASHSQTPFSSFSKADDARQKSNANLSFNNSQDAVPVQERLTLVGRNKEDLVRSPVDTRASNPQAQVFTGTSDTAGGSLPEIRSNELDEHHDVINSSKRKRSPQDSQFEMHKKRKIDYEDASPILEASSNVNETFSNVTHTAASSVSGQKNENATVSPHSDPSSGAANNNYLKTSTKQPLSRSLESVARERKNVGVASRGYKTSASNKRTNGSAALKSSDPAIVRLEVPVLVSSEGKVRGRRALAERDRGSVRKVPQSATGGEKALASEMKSPRRLRKSAKNISNGKLRSLDNVRHTRTGAKIINPLKPLPEAVVSAQDSNEVEKKANHEVLPDTQPTKDQKLENAPLLRSDDAQQVDSDKLSSEISDYLSDSFDPEGELLLAKRSSNAKLHAEKNKPQETAAASQTLPYIANEAKPIHDPEACRKEIEKIVSRQVARKMASARQLGKQLIVSLTQSGIVTHTPFGSGQNVTASNNICNINNYEVSPVLYLQHLSKRGRLEVSEFSQSKIPIMKVTQSSIDASTKEKLKKACNGLLVFIDNYHYGSLTENQKVLVDQRLAFVKSALPKLGMRLTDDMSSQVSIMIAVSEVQNMEDVNSVEATEAYGMQAWSYGYAVEFFKMLLGPEALPSPVLKDKEEGASDNHAQQKTISKVASACTPSNEGDGKAREKEEVPYHENALRELVGELANCVRSTTIDRAVLENCVREISSCVDFVVEEQLIGARLAEQFEAQNRLILAMSDELIQNQIKIASLHGRASSSEKDVDALSLKLSEERSKAENQLSELKSKLEESVREKQQVVPQQAVPQPVVPKQVGEEPNRNVNQGSSPDIHVEEIQRAGVLDHRVVNDIGLIKNALNKRADRPILANSGQEALTSSLTPRRLLSSDSVQDSSPRNNLSSAMLLPNPNVTGSSISTGWQGGLMRVLAALNNQQEAQHVAFRSENVLLREERDALRATLTGFDSILRGQQQRLSQLEEALLRERSKKRSPFDARQMAAGSTRTSEIEEERNALKSRLVGYDNIMRDQQVKLSLLETALQREKLTRKALQARLQTFAHGLVSEDEAEA